jgi:hypothetical protein
MSENTALAKTNGTTAAAAAVAADNGKLYESLALRGDISALAPQEKVKYYAALCERLGLDPMTQPFVPLKLNGKEILYASRAATDQLARIHHVDRRITEEREFRGTFVVTVEATLPSGRKEQSKGAVAIENLKGDALCNALMKAETKAKRRATLAILGLGMLDESEIETIPRKAIESVANPLNPNFQQPSHAAAFEAQKPVEKENISPEDRRRNLVAHVADLCKQLAALGDDSLDRPSKLNSYINEKFEVEDGLNSLDNDSFAALIDELEERISKQMLIRDGGDSLPDEEPAF